MLLTHQSNSEKMRGPEAKLYQKFKRATPKIIWHRIENLAIPGMPDVLDTQKSSGILLLSLKLRGVTNLNFHHTKLPTM